MLNVLKAAAVYTGVYFLIFNAVFWILIFTLTTIQIFWKLFVCVFFIALAIFTWDHFGITAQISKLFRKKVHLSVV